jgi:hypothetical protein
VNHSRLGLLGLTLLFLVGCSINPPLELSQLATGSRQLYGVPFFQQTEYECGPAALAAVLGASGVSITPAALSPQVYLPERQGSLQLELVAATRRAGRIPYVLDGVPQALLEEVAAGSPVLVLQNLRTRDFPVWHYAVLVGFDTAANRVYLNSAAQQGMAVGAPEFMRTWDWAGRWAMVALRPGELPARVDPARYIEAVLDFEAVAGTAASLPAWESARQRWPSEPLPYLALGNHAYAEGDLPAAAAFYRRGLHVSAQHSALANNLATVLGELGCSRAGEAILEPVVAAQPGNTQWAPAFAATLSELAEQRGSDPSSCAALIAEP